MVCTANDLLGWKDFPKGLKVLLLDEDRNSAAEIRSKLEEMDYIVSIFYNEEEALSAISNSSESYHVAIVEVSTGNSQGRFKFLEAAKDLPTIMISNKHCLTTMMKCIALGAVEFLLRPLSEDKLRNIWQHVVHKAFNAGGCHLSKSLLPVKESVVSMIQLQLEDIDTSSIISEDVEKKNGNDEEQSPGKDKYPAPSTPQLEQGVRSVDETNFSMEKESWENDGESKSVETTCGNSAAELDSSTRTDPPLRSRECVVKEEDESANGSKSESIVSDISPNKDCFNGIGGDAENLTKASGIQNSCGTTRSNRKKTKVDWTPELHKKFVQSVEQLGVDQAIPSRILELMKVEGLTRHNVASHLQKFRMHRRHILPKEDDRRWPHPRDPTQRSYFPHKPIMAYPPQYHHNHTITVNQVYPPWGPPSSYAAGVQMWGPSSYPPWQPTESWHWNPYPVMNADAWGCPVMPPPHGVCPPFPQNASGFYGSETLHNSYGMPPNFFDLQPSEDVLDKVVKEAISKPWLPLPLGLKPPSTESVLTELSQQGISNIPPPINGNHLC